VKLHTVAAELAVIPAYVGTMSSDSRPFNVLIAGAGVAGLEAALALRELAGDRLTTTMLAPEPEFVYRPLRVREPFSGPKTDHYSLAEITSDIGVVLKQDTFKWLDAPQHTVHTESGEQLSYDALLMAMGARLRPRFRHALTIDDRKLDEQLHGLIQDLESGYIHKLAFIAPQPMPWPLPLYELALLTARRTYEMNETVSITIVTPEDAPLAVLGDAVSQAVQGVLDSAGIQVISGTHAETPKQGQVSLFPQGGTLNVDRVVALPELFGPSTPGMGSDDDHGFIPIDTHCRVRGLDGVFAAGDATDFAVKYGGIAAQQADVAAEGIAKLAGVAIDPRQFKPEVHGMLLGGAKPLYFSAHITGTHGSASVVEDHANWASGAKIAAKYLAPYLELHSQVSASH
jgi:sulfide:quinone oxidoreductase